MGRPQSETATLVFAVSVAVTLGVACGVWVNTKLTAAASETLRAPSRLTSAATAGQTAPAPDGDAQSVSDDTHQQPVSDDYHPPASADGGEASPNDSNAPSDANVSSDADVPSESQTQSPSSAADNGRKDAPTTAALTPAAREAHSSDTREANPPEKSPAARDRAREANAEPGARPRASGAAPCAPYASAGSLTLRGGGAATLVLGGPGEAGRVSVTTPDWADIAVFSEGRAGGNGWLRYSVRSVSGRPGVYTVHFRTPCGSQRIPVTVTRP
jgi:hypothetical protein